MVAIPLDPVTLHSIVNQRGNQMTRKDFKALAESIRTILDPHARLQAAVAAASACAKANPRFDYDRFYAACGVTQ